MKAWGLFKICVLAFRNALGLVIILDFFSSSLFVAGFAPWRCSGCNDGKGRFPPVLRMAASSIDSPCMLELLQRKQQEIRMLEKAHQEPTDPVQVRLGHVSSTSNLALSRALRLFTLGEHRRRISLVVDMKRRSPTARHLPFIVDKFQDAGRRSRELFEMGASVVMVNTDQIGWGGSLDDLRAVDEMRQRRSAESVDNAEVHIRSAILAKDVYLHPIQIAAAAEAGADGVVLMASLLGSRLEDLLDACTVMGIEAVVDVHTPNECEHALKLGAMALSLNNWDRTDGVWRANQAETVRRLVPDNVVTVAAGGIGSSDEARRLGGCGFDAVALGRALAVHPCPSQLATNICFAEI